MRRRRGLAAVVVALVALSVACGSDSGGSSGGPSSASGDEAAAALPPNDVDQLAEILDPLVEPLGLRLTRGALVDLDAGYEVADDGTHLALYVEPIGPYAIDDYVEGIGTVAALVTPLVFERWPELETYDICQEPPVDEDPRDEPFPATQVTVTREQADAVDWSTAGTVDVLAAYLDEPRGLDLVVSQTVRDSDAYQRAEAAALARSDPT